MDACPICRASLNGATTCRRCRAALDKVQAVERRGQALAMAALRALVEGDSTNAALWLERARRVHATPAVRALRALVASSTFSTSAGATTSPFSMRETCIDGTWLPARRAVQVLFRSRLEIRRAPVLLE